MQYVVNMEGDLPFQTYRLDFVSQAIVKALEEKVMQTSLYDRILALKRNDETGFMATACGAIYESVISDQLTSQSGVAWKKREVIANSAKTGSVNDKWLDFSLRLSQKVEGPPPRFESMQTNVLYVSLNPNFNCVDMMYKTEEGGLIGLQVTRQKPKKKKLSWSALNQFLEAIDFPKDKAALLRFVLIPLPSNAEHATLELEDMPIDSKETCDSFRHVMDKYEVWKLPDDYNWAFKKWQAPSVITV